MEPMTRRNALSVLAGAAASITSAPLFAAAPALRPKRMGIGMHSYGFHWRAAKENLASAKFGDAFEFLKYAHQIGAGGVQVTIGVKDSAYAQRIKSFAEEHEMYFEAQFTLPKDDTDLSRFETDVRLAREAGATVFRTACLNGRRYETFKSAEEFREFRERSWKSLALAEPILKKRRLHVAVENHKDWLIPELLEILRHLSSEWVGVCIDTGNSIALLEDAIEVVEGFAPFVWSTHIKDMGVQESADGFLLSEVPLGDGFLPLKRIVETLRKAKPAIQFNLEMITRDPLPIPCLTASFWATMENAPAVRLAGALATVKQNISSKPLSKTTGLALDQQLAFEDSNVRQSLVYAREQLGL
jgi:3-oxoisoapionate decarboxylase